MIGKIGIALVCAALAAVALDWPSDFADQVANTHPAPSGSQISTSASSLAIDLRRTTEAESNNSASEIEGRYLSWEFSGETEIKATKKYSTLLIII